MTDSITHRTENKRRIVLRTIHEHDGLALRDISRRTGLKAASVKHHIDQLVKEGMVRKSTSAQQGRGRPVDILRPNPRSGYLVGVDMDPARVTAVVANMAHRLVATVELPMDREAGHMEIVDTLIEATRRVIAEADVPDKRIYGVGLALTGFYDRQAGVAITSSSLPRWRNVPIRYLLEEALDYPVTIDDSVTSATLAEKWFGQGKGLRNFLSMRVRTGLSLGIVINGELHRGLGNAGTINNLYVMPQDVALKADQPRTLFELASGHAILDRIRSEANEHSSPQLWRLVEGHPSKIDLETIVAATKTEDPLCTTILCDAARYWGRALAQAIEMLHPEKVLITGSFVELADLLKPPLVESLNQSVLSPLKGSVDVEFSKLDRNASALGAAAMVLRNVIHSC